MQLTLPVDLLRYDLLFIGSFFAPTKIVMGERESIIFKTRTSSNIEFSGKKLTVTLSSKQRIEKNAPNFHFKQLILNNFLEATFLSKFLSSVKFDFLRSKKDTTYHEKHDKFCENFDMVTFLHVLDLISAV